MSDIKLEIGQIWDSDSGIVREILHIGKEKVFYRILHHQDYQRVNDYESSTTIEEFKEHYGKNILPCWPKKKKVKRAQALFVCKENSWPYTPRHWFKDEADCASYTSSKIVEFPLNGLWKEFDE